MSSLRLALGLGDQELEQRLRPAFDAAEDVLVVAQCLAADQLLQAVESREVDAVVVAWSLHRLTDAVLEQLDRSGLPVALLVPDPNDQRWRAWRGPVMNVAADEATIRQALVAARRGEHFISVNRPRTPAQPVIVKDAVGRASHSPGVIAVAGGAGSPGRTMVAINLAAAFGGELCRFEVPFQRPDGSDGTAQVLFAPVRERGRIPKVLALVRDITEQRLGCCAAYPSVRCAPASHRPSWSG